MEFNTVQVTRLLLFGLILSLLICSVPVYAVDYTGTLAPSIPNFQFSYPGGIDAPDVLVYTHYKIGFGIDFDFTGTPKIYGMYFLSDGFSSGTSPFTITEGGDTIATGTVQAMNGTVVFPASGAQQAYYLNFATWTPGARTGPMECVLELPADSTNGITRDGNIFGNANILLGGAPVGNPMGIVWDGGFGGVVKSPRGGELYTPQPYVAKYDYSITGFGGDGPTLISEVILTRPANNLATNVRAYNATSGELLYQAAAASASKSEDFFVVGSGYTLSMYVPVNGVIYNSSVFYPGIVPPTPTGVYAITVVPDTISYLGAATGTIVSGGGDMSKITDISWSWADSTGSYDFNANGNTSRPLDYTKIGATWYGYEVGVGGIGGGYTLNMGVTMPNGLNLNNLSSPGLKTVTCFIGTSDHLWYTLTAPLTVDSSGMQTISLDAKDSATGMLIAHTDFKVKNKANGLWTNVTAPLGTYDFLYPKNSNLYTESSAAGYYTTIKDLTGSMVPTYRFWIVMYKTATIAVGNVTVQVEITDAFNQAPIPGALVHVYPTGQNGESKLTSNSGVATFNTSELSDYTITVTKYGYQNGGTSIVTGAGGTAISITITLQRATAPTPTVTVPTVVPSGVPTTSAIPGVGYTGFWGPFYNMFGAMGAGALTTQLLMACFFVFCGVVVGGFGMGTIIPGAPFSSTGGEAGGVFAFVLACAFGFISILWIVVIFVWLAFRYFLISR